VETNFQISAYCKLAGVAILTSKKTDVTPTLVRRDNEEHYMYVKITTP
jgi:hypothetical protein